MNGDRFHVGDKVVVIQDLCFYNVGDVLTIIRTDGDGHPMVQKDGESDTFFATDARLELVTEDKMAEMKFKVGDKVRILNGWYRREDKDDRNNRDVGKVGMIVEVSDYDKNCRLHVEWSYYATDYWYHPIDIKLVSKKDKPKTELRIVYKRLYLKTNGDWRSVNGDPLTTVTYNMNTKTKKPKGGNPLLAFATLSDAEAFGAGAVLVRCVAKVHATPDFSFMSQVAPDGSVLCDWVFPIEKVWSDE